VERGSVQAGVEVGSLLDRGLAEIGLEVTEPQREALLELARLVDRWGERINLTGHRGPSEIVKGLLLASIALAAHLPEVESLADLGSGAGIPGLPIAILRPSCSVTLVEARLKRHHFQRVAVRALHLGNAAPILGRAERLEPKPHAAAVAQAVARPEAALELMIPWIAPGGLAVLPGGPKPPCVAHPRAGPARSIRYRLPCGGAQRSLWIARIS
jgi:16S rRNA (guanine527-N7)-methyltransferase